MGHLATYVEEIGSAMVRKSHKITNNETIEKQGRVDEARYILKFYWG
jgi:hypothetical protein